MRIYNYAHNKGEMTGRILQHRYIQDLVEGCFGFKIIIDSKKNSDSASYMICFCCYFVGDMKCTTPSINCVCCMRHIDHAISAETVECQCTQLTVGHGATINHLMLVSSCFTRFMTRGMWLSG